MRLAFTKHIPQGLSPSWLLAVRIIHASFRDEGSEPSRGDSDRMVVSCGKRNAENLKNSAGNPSSPGDFPDCIDDVARAIWDG